MRIYSALRVRTWILTVGVIILIAGHGIFLYFASHMPLSAAVVSGALVLVLIKHFRIARFRLRTVLAARCIAS